ncbi:uncharacterized protein TrAtP1_000918 [Trichoderma atroviride]|uniref:uncharacterized protein n=1 Tax=Hypocrea atroviridis TaxID=63577 RepID=UPI00332CEACB|nr:hypothetical protein TrAtP1_000918 [Trichoderma atroviride]
MLEPPIGFNPAGTPNHIPIPNAPQSTAKAMFKPFHTFRQIDYAKLKTMVSLKSNAT